MKVTWLGHSGFVLEDGATSIVIDPWITDNPQGVELPQDVRPSLILLTHGHFDHLGDCVRLSGQFDVPILCMPELSAFCKSQGAESELINYGGSFELDGISIKCVLAFHSSSAGPDRIYAGPPCGFVISTATETIYHAGDTCVFGDMRMIGDRRPLDLAILPIGGRTTMDPEEALQAVNLLRPRAVVPMHFNTWPFIRQDPVAFKAAVEEVTPARVLLPEPGQAEEIRGEDPA